MVLRLAAAVAAALLLAIVAAAHDEHDPRHMAMEDLGNLMRSLDRAARGPGPLGAQAQQDAQSILARARGMLQLFGETTRGRANSRETPEIWSDWAGFEQAAKRFEHEAEKLAMAAASGDGPAVLSALKATGATCAGCHQRYRAPKR